MGFFIRPGSDHCQPLYCSLTDRCFRNLTASQVRQQLDNSFQCFQYFLSKFRVSLLQLVCNLFSWLICKEHSNLGSGVPVSIIGVSGIWSCRMNHVSMYSGRGLFVKYVVLYSWEVCISHSCTQYMSWLIIRKDMCFWQKAHPQVLYGWDKDKEGQGLHAGCCCWWNLQI